MSYQPRPLQPTRYLPSPTSSPIKGVESAPFLYDKLPSLAVFDEETFKIPALPRYRLITPSSSTIAASSSPQPSSPIRSTRTRAPIREITLQSDKITVLGRHRHHSTSSLSPGFHHLLSDPTRRVESVRLPRTASHASRIHCAAEVTDEGVRLAVMGQNGVRVRYDGKSVRMQKGEWREFGGAGAVDVDFYGCKVRLIPSLPSLLPRASPSLPPSSPPRSPSPVLSKPAPVPVPPVDLPALLATTVVFSGSSKLSLPDLVKHMLESQPSLIDHGDEAQWTEWASVELEGNPMFGKVQRHGKDSSGHPLLPHYFYVPDADPDASRAKELGGLVRPLRAAQRAGGKAIDWRPVGSGRRRYQVRGC